MNMCVGVSEIEIFWRQNEFHAGFDVSLKIFSLVFPGWRQELGQVLLHRELLIEASLKTSHAKILAVL